MSPGNTDVTEVKPKASRQAFGEALAELGAKYQDVVVLDADLSKSTKTELFAKKFPERFFNAGIAEQNMLGVAAGLALSGKTAFCASFACFVAGRFETAKISVAYSGANVKIVGTHAGIGIGEDGYSQMGLEDLALMRVLPTFEVFQPADDVETAQILEYLCQHPGPAYLRLTRQNLARVHDPKTYKFAPGKLDTLAGGKDIAILATGGTVQHAMHARDLLAPGLDVAVVNVPSIKPIDVEGLRALSRSFKLLVTAEDHNVLGGMGSAVTEAIAGFGAPVRVVRHGLPDVFGESGSPEALYAKYRLDAAGIADVVRQAWSEK